MLTHTCTHKLARFQESAASRVVVTWVSMSQTTLW